MLTRIVPAGQRLHRKTKTSDKQRKTENMVESKQVSDFAIL